MTPPAPPKKIAVCPFYRVSVTFFSKNIANSVHVRVRVYLALAERQAGVDVLSVHSLQEAAAAVQRWLLPPRLEVAEQLTVHLRQQPLAC